jgi:enamine deaminase RidA (YjgF/YER057c/UK114 family)
MENQDAIGEVMDEYYQGNYPAGTMIEVKRLVDKRLKLEVNLIAALPNPDRSQGILVG